MLTTVQLKKNIPIWILQDSNVNENAVSLCFILGKSTQKFDTECNTETQQGIGGKARTFTHTKQRGCGLT